MSGLIRLKLRIRKIYVDSTRSLLIKQFFFIFKSKKERKISNAIKIKYHFFIIIDLFDSIKCESRTSKMRYRIRTPATVLGIGICHMMVPLATWPIPRINEILPFAWLKRK